MPDKYKGKIGGYLLDMETLEDGFSKAITRDEYPYRNKAKLDDLGLKATSIKIRCYFLNEEYETHFEFIKFLQKRKEVEFVHPQYGVKTGAIEQVNIRHDDRDRCAEVDITFIEGVFEHEMEELIEIEDVEEMEYVDGAAEAMWEYEDDIGNALGAANEVLTTVVDATKDIIDNFSTVTGKVRTYVRQVDTMVGTIEGTLNYIQNPANSLIATINWGTHLPGRILGATARCVERYSLLYDSLKNSPKQFIQSMNNGLDALKASLPQTDKDPVKQAAIDNILKIIQLAKAQGLALETAKIFKTDQVEREKVKKAERTKSFSREGKYIGPPPAETITTVNALGNPVEISTAPAIITITDIEEMIALVRTEIQTAVDAAREATALKAMARDLLIHVEKVKLEVESIREVEVKSAMPLHMVCMQYGLPYNYAERIMSINPQIKNPSRVRGMIKIYALDEIYA